MQNFIWIFNIYIVRAEMLNITCEISPVKC